MPKARVLHVLPDLSVAGGTTIVKQHLEYSDRERFDVRIVSLGADRSSEPWFDSAGAPPVVIDVEAVGRLRGVWRAISQVRDADLVHIHEDLGRDVGGAAAFCCRVPVVSHLHGEWVHLRPVRSSSDVGRLRRIRRAAVRRCRVLLERATVARYVADSRSVVRSYEPVVRRPISACRLSVPSDAIVDAWRRGAGPHVRAELGIPPRAPVILSVARMVVGKGQADLMTMFETVSQQHPDAVLVLVGDGPLREPLLADLANHPAGDRIRTPGARQDVSAFLAAADVFVHASSTEAFGLVILEAMAAGVPVVAFELPAYAEFVAPSGSADLVALGDVAAFADAVSALLDDPTRAARLGSCGQALVREHHPPDAVARSFEAIYTEVLSKRAYEPPRARPLFRRR